MSIQSGTPAARVRPEDAPAALVRAGQRVATELRGVVDGLEPQLARICGYHFGWRDADGRPTDDGHGKLLRARLTLLAAEAAGADPAVAVPGAVAVELVHNFSLLHDDIMDADELRRGRPAAWVVFGQGMATLAGDALLAAAFCRLAPLAAGPTRRAATVLPDALHRMIAGQSADLALEGPDVDHVEVDHYLRACDKTSALLEAASAIGAALAGADEQQLTALRRAGYCLGVSWQIANDVEDIWGDTGVTGKPELSDLRRSKKTLPVILALRSGQSGGARLAEALRAAGPQPSEPEVQQWARLVEAAGGRAGAERLSRSYLEDAVDQLRAARLAARPREELVRLFRRMVLRES
ncbi:polyprenyl synthetase family protein [Micromonospora echinofusca]|uniref:Polyprenyl synthetase family protein n=1 Tax=Micromonospora echinofusca TaxID=47858 RepID=A0ABS3VP30_MICEH|nr:polyprenyl synthetase family protein [Micromonospora echinofusca]MBO4206265.1 polyprenyl synthetase family protein [Micromonospora echinofusca]